MNITELLTYRDYVKSAAIKLLCCEDVDGIDASDLDEFLMDNWDYIKTDPVRLIYKSALDFVVAVNDELHAVMIETFEDLEMMIETENEPE